MNKLSAEQEIIQHHNKNHEFITDMDGFVYFLPRRCHGHFSSAALRVIADELDRRNADWQREIDDYFNHHP